MFLYSLIKQFYLQFIKFPRIGTQIGTEKHRRAITELRKRCHDYIVDNLEEFKLMILNEISEMNGWDIGWIINEEHTHLVQSYLDAILEDGAWCGSEMIAAVVNLYQVNINIFTEDSEPWKFTIPNVENEINLFYGGGAQKNHYDLVVKVETNPSKSSIPRVEYQSMTERQTPGRAMEADLEGNSIFVAIVKAWLGPNLSKWQTEVNALNLRRAAIKELSSNFDHYKTNSIVFRETAKDRSMDILTHWNEENQTVDIGIGAAIAEVIKAEISIWRCDSENITFSPRSGPALQKIMIQESRYGMYEPEESAISPGGSQTNNAYMTESVASDLHAVTDSER